jgi:uncharacterized iron-regulated membrane protein
LWLDLHNVLGILSLPFHLIMALTAVVFAFHDQFDHMQGATFARGTPGAQAEAAPPAGTGVFSGSPHMRLQTFSRLREQAVEACSLKCTGYDGALLTCYRPRSCSNASRGVTG